MAVLRVRRDDLNRFEMASEDPGAEATGLEDGEARLRVERFALTANNITYGVTGDALGYWKLFPDEDGWGRIPAWGYATVAASRAEGVSEGARFWGLVPMGTEVTMRPAPNPIGFADSAEHRASLSPVYNQYMAVEGDGDDYELILRPL